MEDLLIHVSRRAMACEFEVCFPAAAHQQGTDAALEALDRVDALEAQISCFRPDSELSRVNLLAAEGPVEVGPELFDLLALAMRLYEETGGAYDITSAPLWEVWGFARRAGSIPSDADLAKARSSVGGYLVELDPSARTVRFRKPGVKINLASIGKGLALDLCAGSLRASGMGNFLLHGGQSSVLAAGSPRSVGPQVGPACRAGSEDPSQQPPWEIGVRHPFQPDQRLAVVRLRDRTLGTSGSQFQSFYHQGRRYGHILDPRSGRPAEGVLSTTVVAPEAALADALSTAFYVMGVERSQAYCRTRPGIGAVLLSSAPRGGGVQLHTMGLGEEEFAELSDGTKGSGEARRAGSH
jgi:FAD:protein FMN transferase